MPEWKRNLAAALNEAADRAQEEDDESYEAICTLLGQLGES
jgi:hypothetical protein